MTLTEGEAFKAQYRFRGVRSTERTILGLQAIIQKALEQRKGLAIIFVDLRKAFDALPTFAIQNRLQKLNCSRNLIHSVKSLLNVPKGTIKGSQEGYYTKRGVRKGSIEGPLLFNITFQALLEEAISPLEDKAITLTTKTGER